VCSVNDKIHFLRQSNYFISGTIVLRRESATLDSEQLKPGTYETEWDASGYSSGIYYYKIISRDFTETKKMILIK
jgi:hypothetical protein